jgi:hypothetical protein
MSRTIAEIYDEIIAEKENQTSLAGLTPDPETSLGLLNDLSSGSRVAIWRLWAYITAVAIWTHEQVFELFLEEAEAIAAAAPAGTARWYQKKVLEFQFGDSLQYVNNQYVYDPIDPSARIVTRCAVQDRGDGVVVVKVAKDVTPTPLNSTEKTALEGYIAKIKFAGTRVAVLSQDADEIDLDYDIFYDPIVPLATLQARVQNAIDAYATNLEFNGEVRINKITDALQVVDGVVDPVFQAATGTPDGGGTSSIMVSYQPIAGHIVYADTAANMFTFIPQPTP